jgi:hypothetical protein
VFEDKPALIVKEIPPAWYRAPDSTNELPKGQIEAEWICHRRMVSVLFVGEIAEITCLRYNHQFKDWFLRSDMIYDATNPEAREQAWIWLCGGPAPTVPNI